MPANMFPHVCGQSCRFKASTDPAIRSAQQTLVEAWAYVGNQYLDPTFKGNNWNKLLQVPAPRHCK